MNYDEFIKESTKVAEAFSTRIDFEKVISDGLIKKVGHSYYAENIRSLPESVRIRIKSIATPTKHGIKVTFHKESKRLKKLLEKFKLLSY
jgi:dTDP-glucose pyrophosphorylase